MRGADKADLVYLELSKSGTEEKFNVESWKRRVEDGFGFIPDFQVSR